MGLKKKKRGKAKLTRTQLVYVKSDETVADLERRVKTANARPKACPKSLPLGTIRVADKVFQWRMPSENIVAKEDHIFDLANALLDREKPLDPILVFPVGERYYVVDGHHRINAYHSAKWKNPVPVKVFNGSFQDARIEAFRRNSKNKLAMTKQDKMEGTWRLVKEGNLSISTPHEKKGHGSGRSLRECRSLAAFQPDKSIVAPRVTDHASGCVTGLGGIIERSDLNAGSREIYLRTVVPDCTRTYLLPQLRTSVA